MRAELTRLRAPLAAAGLGLGVALESEAAARPAGPAEAAIAARMIPSRRREFMAGRLAARRALRSVGLDCGDIPRAGRLPVFPPGLAASITHSEGVAVSVALGPGRSGAPGCDLELRELPSAASRFVLREDEEDWLHAVNPALLPARLLTLFSAKEAAWKALRGLPPHGAADTGADLLPGTLRDLRAVPTRAGFRIEARGGSGTGVDVRVRKVATGVFSWVCP
ncbi:4'-phosphopantetheinyl transferase superfamily protein [Streptomyces sp. NPDC005551]|uniref:4'-phosphopantetheinyl transferase superfamily protein n=1 Tax=unclassified Streptomyces TaxID=2593676 RepID=UPI0033D9216B